MPSVALLGLVVPTDAANACSPNPFIGSVCFTAGRQCPQQYILADGRNFNIQDQKPLFTVIGTTFGGDVTKGNFNIPDLSSRIPIGAGPSKSFKDLNIARGQAVGNPTSTLLVANMPAHTHEAKITTQVIDVPITVPASPSQDLKVDVQLSGVDKYGANGIVKGAYFGKGGSLQNSAPIYYSGTVAETEKVSLSGLSATISGKAQTPEFSTNAKMPTVSSVTNNPVGGSLPFAILSPVLGLTACIANDGTMPSPN